MVKRILIFFLSCILPLALGLLIARCEIIANENNAARYFQDRPEPVDIEAAESLKPGDSVYFGEYSGNPLAWRVLEQDGGTALLITELCVAKRPFNDRRAPAVWETSDLREWLNNDFYNSAFTEAQKSCITVTDTAAEGPVTSGDKIFLLDPREAGFYFADNTERLTLFEGKTASWWLRTAGIGKYTVYTVSYNGRVDRATDEYPFAYVESKGVGVRPVLRYRYPAGPGG
ncbi:MAG: DUF6273 domain-containing protein [Clostridiales bacterium]|jgi:hypothetical protein|nr:DUF6273 domain-containing protein [Clostridiales bacterium]